MNAENTPEEEQSHRNGRPGNIEEDREAAIDRASREHSDTSLSGANTVNNEQSEQRTDLSRALSQSQLSAEAGSHPSEGDDVPRDQRPISNMLNTLSEKEVQQLKQRGYVWRKTETGRKKVRLTNLEKQTHNGNDFWIATTEDGRTVRLSREAGVRRWKTVRKLSTEESVILSAHCQEGKLVQLQVNGEFRYGTYRGKTAEGAFTFRTTTAEKQVEEVISPDRLRVCIGKGRDQEESIAFSYEREPAKQDAGESEPVGQPNTANGAGRKPPNRIEGSSEVPTGTERGFRPAEADNEHADAKESSERGGEDTEKSVELVTGKKATPTPREKQGNIFSRLWSGLKKRWMFFRKDPRALSKVAIAVQGTGFIASVVITTALLAGGTASALAIAGPVLLGIGSGMYLVGSYLNWRERKKKSVGD